MPADRNSLIEQILAEDRKQAKLLKGVAIDQMELAVAAAAAKHAAELQVLHQLHAQLASAEQVMQQRKATYDVLQGELEVAQAALKPCELSVWSSWSICSAECDGYVNFQSNIVIS